jgi:hypothetical protein
MVARTCKNIWQKERPKIKKYIKITGDEQMKEEKACIQTS